MKLFDRGQQLYDNCHQLRHWKEVKHTYWSHRNRSIANSNLRFIMRIPINFIESNYFVIAPILYGNKK